MEIRDLRIRCAELDLHTTFIINISHLIIIMVKASFLIHDTTRWRLTYDFYTELANITIVYLFLMIQME